MAYGGEHVVCCVHAAGDALILRVIEGVQADVDAVETGLAQLVQQRREQEAVGGQRYLTHAGNCLQRADKIRTAPADKRFAACDLEPVNAQRRRRTCDAQQLLIPKQCAESGMPPAGIQ